MQKIFLWLACLGISTAYAESYITTPEQVDGMPIATAEPQTTSMAIYNYNKSSEINNKNPLNSLTKLEAQKLKALSTHPQWHHLLFYKDGKAEVISPDFYFTNQSTKVKPLFNPYKELLATLDNINDAKSICRYPARYLWLNHQLPELNINLQACPDLPDANQDISLILVSNYLKNPASSFGHVLVKNNDAAKTKDSTVGLSGDDLLNSSYNFGARIPANENGVMYAIKGLFGVYDAGFSEAEFFKQDAVYSKNEQRDMWEYVLNLEAFDTQLLNYHLYEAKSARFDYYFLKQNCGYRSGEILELISEVKATERVGPWYAPDYVFDQLVEYRNSTSKPDNSYKNTAPLVASVRYLPSEQTQLRAKFAQLPKSMQTIVNSVIRTQDLTVLTDLEPADKALVIDFLIMHRTYKISQKDTPEHQIFKKKLLSQRFNLPASNELAALIVPEKVSPALSNKTSQTKVSVSDERAQLGLSLFVKDPLNNYTDIDKRFEAVRVSLGYDFDDKLALTDFVFLDMQQIENIAQPLAGEPKLSWGLKTGARTDIFNGNSHSPYAQAGIGAGVMMGTNVLGYSLVNATVHDQDRHLDVGIELGIRTKRRGQAAELTYNAIKRIDRSSLFETQLTLRQQLSKNDDARIIITHTDATGSVADEIEGLDAGVAWHHYW